MEIINYKEINKDAIISSFDVFIKEWGLTFKRCAFFRKENKSWITLPNQTYQSKDGVTKSFPLVAFDKDRHNRFQKSCIDKINRGEFKKESTEQNLNVPF